MGRRQWKPKKVGGNHLEGRQCEPLGGRQCEQPGRKAVVSHLGRSSNKKAG